MCHGPRPLGGARLSDHQRGAFLGRETGERHSSRRIVFPRVARLAIQDAFGDPTMHIGAPGADQLRHLDPAPGAGPYQVQPHHRPLLSARLQPATYLIHAKLSPTLHGRSHKGHGGAYGERIRHRPC